MNEFLQLNTNNGVATLTINRPDKRNAMHGPLVSQMLHTLQTLANDRSRLLVVRANGEHFCAGGDIAWMQQVATGPEDQNYDDAQLLANMLYELYQFPKPTLALVHGKTLGGGMGVISACDMVIAAGTAQFGLPEVKIGITPSIVSPYVIAAIGERNARYYFLSGELFNAETALRLGLIHQVVPAEKLGTVGEQLTQSILKNSPNALMHAKRLLRKVSREKITSELAQRTAEHLAELRVSREAQEGLKAFLEKRSPEWMKG